MSRGLRRAPTPPIGVALSGLVALALAFVAAAAAGAAQALPEDPYAAYRAKHPEVAEEDLLEVRVGDRLPRVLAVLHHPDAGFDPLELQVVHADRPGAEPVTLPPELAPAGGLPPLVVAVRQRCPPPGAAPFG